MRFWIGGPRIFGLRPGVSFGPEDFRRLRQPAGAADSAENTMIYVIRGAHDHLKIGVSNNPSARLATLQTGSPTPVSFAYIGAVTGSAYEVERAAHGLLSRHRGSGEWFDVPLEMAVGAIAAATVRCGQKIVEIPADRVDEVVRRAREEDQAAPPQRGDKFRKFFIALTWTVFAAFAGLLLLAGVPWQGAILPTALAAYFVDRTCRTFF